jgi:hypothetical protein
MESLENIILNTMDLQITKAEAKERVKGGLGTYLGVVIMMIALGMIVCKIYDAFTDCCPDLHFSVATEIIPIMLLGYALFVARPSLIQGMVGMLLPKK